MPVPPAPAVVAPRPVAVPAVAGAGEALLHRALAATTSGVTIADFARPDQPLVYVNAAFEELSGFRVEEVLGRNCRFLQGPDTDPAAVDRIRAALAAGEECRETLLNYRGPERTPWWNEIYLAPVLDDAGRVVQYIGVQNDVTARVEAERALERERDRAQSYLGPHRAARLHRPADRAAQPPPARGRSRRRCWTRGCRRRRSRCCSSTSTASSRSTTAHGHAAGDERARRAPPSGSRPAAPQRPAWPGSAATSSSSPCPALGPRRRRGSEAERVARGAAPTTSAPRSTSAGEPSRVGASMGVSVYPATAATSPRCCTTADRRMYEAKTARRGAAR